jgi:hypothetical protein
MKRLVLTLFSVSLALGVATDSVALDVLRPAVPMPALTAAEAGVPAFVGTPATSQPIAPLVIPNHPELDNDGDSRIHNDHYNSGVYNRPGPLGVNPTVTTSQLLDLGFLAKVCAMLAFTDEGYVIGTCIRAEIPVGGTDLLLMDPVTLDILAEVELAPRPVVQNSSGGAYFSVLDDGRILVGPANNRVEIWEIVITGNTANFVQSQVFDVSGLIPAGTMLADTVVDYEGRLWFMANTGQVGYVDPSDGSVESLDFGEELQNSMAVDDSGVYLITFEEVRKFSVAPDGSIVIDWAVPYDPGSAVQGVLQGSGTTPTLLGEQDDLIAICDNADDQINLVVLDRTTAAEVCKTPIFQPGASATENSVVGYGDEIVIANNSGFGGVFAPQNTVNPGLEKYRVRADRSGCDLVWANPTSIGNSAQLSTETGLIYGWAADPNVPGLDAYYFTANEWATGTEVFRIYAGNDYLFNPVLGQPHLSQDGAAYMGTMGGIVRIGWEVVPVDIDVRPFSTVNKIPAKPYFPIVVALLGSTEVDVSLVDTASLAFGPDEAAPIWTGIFDVNWDGEPDLISKYFYQDTGLPMGEVPACLEGLLDGAPFEGCDTVNVFMPSCGLGFELALLLPPMLWLRGRRRRLTA